MLQEPKQQQRVSQPHCKQAGPRRKQGFIPEGTRVPPASRVCLWLSPLLSEDTSSSFSLVSPVQHCKHFPPTPCSGRKTGISSLHREPMGSAAASAALLLDFRAVPSHPALPSTIPWVLCPQTPSLCSLKCHRNPKKPVSASVSSLGRMREV